MSVGGSPLPVANWILQFHGFREVIDGLRVHLGGGTLGLRRAALTTNLRHELVRNLRHLLYKSDEVVSPKYKWAGPARAQFAGAPDGRSSIDGQYLKWLSMFGMVANVGRMLSTQFLRESLVSGEFLEFDRASDSYITGQLQAALIALERSITRLRTEGAAFSFSERMELVTRSGKPEDSTLKVENLLLIGVLSIHDRHANIVRLSRGRFWGHSTATPVDWASSSRHQPCSPMRPYNSRRRRQLT